MNEDARQTNNTGTALALATAWGAAGVGTYFGAKAIKAGGELAYNAGTELYNMGKKGIKKMTQKPVEVYDMPGGPTVENLKKQQEPVIKKPVSHKEKDVVDKMDAIDINNIIKSQYDDMHTKNMDKVNFEKPVKEKFKPIPKEGPVRPQFAKIPKEGPVRNVKSDLDVFKELRDSKIKDVKPLNFLDNLGDTIRKIRKR